MAEDHNDQRQGSMSLRRVQLRQETSAVQADVMSMGAAAAREASSGQGRHCYASPRDEGAAGETLPVPNMPTIRRHDMRERRREAKLRQRLEDRIQPLALLPTVDGATISTHNNVRYCSSKSSSRERCTACKRVRTKLETF
jgi:hypothetical protein